MASQFTHVQGNRPRRSAFDLSHEKKLTCDMGQLIPVFREECIPGDTFKLGANVFIRMQPLVAPVMHSIRYSLHYFFVPHRLVQGRNLMEYDSSITVPEAEFEELYTGGVDGLSDIVFPLWRTIAGTDPLRSVGSLWDYLDYPVGSAVATNLPNAWDKRAYQLIYNEYYRDENLQPKVSLDDEILRYRCWSKDYFTSALPFQQRGISPSFPLSGFGRVGATTYSGDPSDPVNPSTWFPFSPSSASTATNSIAWRNAGFASVPAITGSASNTSPQTVLAVDLSPATVGFDMNDLRTAVQVQRWLELNARAGVRLVEFIPAHFGVRPPDYRLQRPEYIGGLNAPLVVSEVLQTSSSDTTTPQGNMAGHGITADQGYIGSYHCTEPGFIMGVMSIMPDPVYIGTTDRQMLKRTRYDFPFPEFVHLSEQMISTQELSGVEPFENFGYQGRFDEYRTKQNKVCGLFRTDLKFWHLARDFQTVKPLLSGEFVNTAPSTIGAIRKDIFAFYADTPEAAGFLVNLGLLCKAVRPLPWMPTPGRLDHVGGM